MPTYIRIRRDGIPIHRHATDRNPAGTWHGAWERHNDDSHNAQDAAHPVYETAGRNTVHMRVDTAINHGLMSQAQWEMYERSLAGEVLIHWYARKQERRSGRSGTVTVTPTTPDDWMLPLSDRQFGVEIECCSNLTLLYAAFTRKGLTLRNRMLTYDHETPLTWKAMRDGSVRNGAHGYEDLEPVEIVSPILRGADGLRQLKLVCEALAEVGTKVNTTCGLHVHHDANDMDVIAARRIAMNYHNGQTAINKLLAPSRRVDHHEYTRPFSANDISLIQRAESIGDFPRDRYRNINIAPAWMLHHTFEIRQHQGSIEFEKIAGWVKLGQAMMERGKAGVMVETGTANLGTFFNKMNLPMHLRMFFRKRGMALKTITDGEGEYILNGASEPVPEAQEPLPDIAPVFTRNRQGQIIPNSGAGF